MVRTNFLLVQCKPNRAERQALFCANPNLLVFCSIPAIAEIRENSRPRRQGGAIDNVIQKNAIGSGEAQAGVERAERKICGSKAKSLSKG
jgi:hypothetical protein